MPELPDVARFQHHLDSTSLRQPIVETTVREEQVLEDGLTPQGLGRRLKGASFRESRRHGKYLFVDFGGKGRLAMHFGMTGDLAYGTEEEELPDHARIVFHFENGRRLAYVSQRMFGRVGFTDDVEAYLAERDMGPDALNDDLTGETFRERLAGRRAALKTALMDQSVLAGVGNECSDEILFQAGLHPKASVADLGEERLDALFNTLRNVLRTLVDCRVHGRELPEAFLYPHRSEGGTCPACGEDIATLKLNSRTGYFCPRCQPEPEASGR